VRTQVWAHASRAARAQTRDQAQAQDPGQGPERDQPTAVHSASMTGQLTRRFRWLPPLHLPMPVWRALVTWRAALARHPALRYVQIAPIALVLWLLSYAASFRDGAARVGLHNAVAVNSISIDLGGGIGREMNDWLATHYSAALAATWYYILFQGAITGIVGVVLIWRRAPHFSLHRNALIIVTGIGLAAFWFYPVAPPRMLAGYHDIIRTAVPLFANVVESKGADQFASLPSLHVAWALWVAVSCTGMLRHPAAQAAIWLYPVATTLDVMSTANHYLLDVITAPVILLLAYGIAATPALGRFLVGKYGHLRPELIRAPVLAVASAGQSGWAREGWAREGWAGQGWAGTGQAGTGRVGTDSAGARHSQHASDRESP